MSCDSGDTEMNSSASQASEDPISTSRRVIPNREMQKNASADVLREQYHCLHIKALSNAVQKAVCMWTDRDKTSTLKRYSVTHFARAPLQCRVRRARATYDTVHPALD